MELNNKSKILIGIGLFVAGGATVYFSVPTKIETKVEVREKIVEIEKKQKLTGKTKIETKKETLPNGSIIESEIVENDGSIQTDSNESSKETEKIESKVITNPKNFRLGLSYKADFNNFSLDNLMEYKNNTGISVQYDTNFLINGQFIGAEVFGDGTIILTLGVSL